MSKSKSFLLVLKCIITFLFLVALIGAFFYLSSQTTTNIISEEGIAHTVGEWIYTKILHKDAATYTSTTWLVADLSIFKLAHICGNFLIGLFCFSFITSCFAFKKKKTLIEINLYCTLSWCLCFIHACLDELHQCLVDGRAEVFSIFDVGIDIIGFSVAIGISAFILLLARYHKLKKLKVAPEPPSKPKQSKNQINVKKLKKTV